MCCQIPQHVDHDRCSLVCADAHSRKACRQGTATAMSRTQLLQNATRPIAHNSGCIHASNSAKGPVRAPRCVNREGGGRRHAGCRHAARANANCSAADLRTSLKPKSQRRRFGWPVPVFHGCMGRSYAGNAQQTYQRRQTETDTPPKKRLRAKPGNNMYMRTTRCKCKTPAPSPPPPPTHTHSIPNTTYGRTQAFPITQTRAF